MLKKKNLKKFKRSKIIIKNVKIYKIKVLKFNLFIYISNIFKEIYVSKLKIISYIYS